MPGPSEYEPEKCNGTKKEQKSFTIVGKKKQDLLNIDYLVPGMQTYFPWEVKKRIEVKFGLGQRSTVH